MATDEIYIENQNLFNDALEQGINLFLGSGFSVLSKGEAGKSLPMGTALRDELVSRFNLKNLSGYDLSQVASYIEGVRRDEFYEFIKHRFSVSEYSDLYNQLSRINVRNIFTTNVDDLILKVYAKGSRFYISDVTQSGPAFSDKDAVDYFPLHGCVAHANPNLIFNRIDIASAFSRQPDKWYSFTERLHSLPTIFWGYSINDSGVLQSLSANRSIHLDSKPKWIVSLSISEGDKALYEAMGFYVINADTAQLLNYIKRWSPRNNKCKLAHSCDDDELAKYSIPQLGCVPARGVKEFFMGAEPMWYDIFSNNIPKTSYYDKIRDMISSGRDCVIVGIPACGKSTLLMQVAASYLTDSFKLVFGNISLAKAEMVMQRLNNRKAMVFMDNFTDSLDAFLAFSSQKNIQVIGFDREHNVESVSHLLKPISACYLGVTDLTLIDMQKVIDAIPSLVRRSDAHVPQVADGMFPSIFEIVDQNIDAPSLRDRYKTFMANISKTDHLLCEVLLMVSYVHKCGVPVSFDMVWAYLSNDVSSYKEVYDIMERCGRLVSDSPIKLIDDEQDYFVPRSSIIAEALFSTSGPADVRGMLVKFFKNVSLFRIYNYGAFRRRAYDKDVIARGFVDWEDGLQFYEYLYSMDSTPYLMQQCALYLSLNKRHKEAFAWADKAVCTSNGRIPSIRNTYAVVLFKANISADVSLVNVVETLNESMDILQDCYFSDKRKMYHALVFADQAIDYHKMVGGPKSLDYIVCAKQWIEREIQFAPWNRNAHRLLRALGSRVR